LLNDIYELTKIRPTPASEWDLMGTAMLSFINWRCRPEGHTVLRTIKQEVEQRLEAGTPALTDEKHRLLFVSNPPWYKVHEIQQWLAERDAVFVISSIGKTFESIATYEDFPGMCTSVSKHWPNWSLEENVRWHQRLIDEWGCDGVVMMDNRACKPIAFPMAETAAILEDDLGIPCLRFEGNMADSRDLDDQKVREQLDAFIDLLEDR
jgi:benzoyl-CoA reductase/2-hydroxyglutaryl-CoA dehydratase subunit BcrC/BadD/HgdB